MSIMLVSSELYKKSSKTQKVRCEICANYCKIAEGKVGVCRQHKNINGELFDKSYGMKAKLACADSTKTLTASYLTSLME